MSSVGSYIKQQNRVYGALGAGTPAHIDLPLFTRSPFDPSNPNSTSGNFQTYSGISTFNSSTGLTPIFRDMGQVIRSAGRTFRRVQMLTQIPSTFGVAGSPSANAVVSDYRTYWYEVSMIEGGAGDIGPLFQIQG